MAFARSAGESASLRAKTHSIGMEVAFWKMLAADAVVVRLDGGVFGRLEHSHDFRLSSQLKQIVVVPGVASKRLPVAFEQFDFAVNGKHLLHERSPEVQERHGEGGLILGAHGLSSERKKLADVGAEFEIDGRLASAGRAGFEPDPVGHFAGSAEALNVGKNVAAPEPADGFALAG